MKNLIIILLSLTMIGCSVGEEFEIREGKEFKYCTSCGTTLNPFREETLDVKILDIQGDYIKYSIGEDVYSDTERTLTRRLYTLEGKGLSSALSENFGKSLLLMMLICIPCCIIIAVISDY